MHKVGTVHEFCMFSGTHGALSPKDTVSSYASFSPKGENVILPGPRENNIFPPREKNCRAIVYHCLVE